MTVSVEKRDGLAIVTIDNPPVNATSVGVRRGLDAAREAIEADAGVAAVVLRCAGRTFVAGADVREFGQPPEPPHLPDLFRAIEACPKPWVAAIHGTALGGGLELAMACHGRVAARGARLGLPEVTLGLIPGAGGTVRLPRLVPVAMAVTMIAGGKPVDADEALDVGLVDEVVEKDELVAAATALAARLSREGHVRTLSRTLPETGVENIDAVAAPILKRARGQTAPEAAVEAVKRALVMAPEEALAAERDTFLALKDNPQSAALRHIFFAERATLKLDRLNGVAPRPVGTVGVVGGGTMGAGIAAACLLADLRVVMVERDADAAEAGRGRVADILGGSLKRGIIDEGRHAALLAQFAVSETLEALAPADLVIEAVFENMEVKQALFRELDEVTRPEAILATNTSYLDVNQIAGVLRDPARALGLHFFSPAHIMKLLEIVVADATADDVLATGAALAKRLGKIGVVAGVCDGFIGNRIMSRYRLEAEAMLAEGVLPWDIDAAMTDFGFPMGLFAMQDLAGLDIAKARRDARGETGHVADPLVAAGRLGRKTGRGWYRYDEGRAQPDPEVEAMLARWRGTELADAPGPHDIMPRILGAMQDEGRRIVAEGVARHPDDVDVVMVHGYGFPRHKGGPMFMAGHDA